ncbi:MAG: sterol desaturase family protein [Acidobacteria bacterium]|nr:sterol desaturase family protein [Acidobacteriota bacterium]
MKTALADKILRPSLTIIFMIVFASFIILAALTFAVNESRRAALARHAQDWMLDAAGLVVQGVLLPLVQIALVYWLFATLAPRWQGALAVSPTLAFLLNFVLVDYLYYWNHRLLHGKTWWDIHAVHHSAEHMDVFITSRNTLWTSLLMVYLWVNGGLIFLLQEPQAFLVSASITASLDLWRHSAFFFTPPSLRHRLVAAIFITPREHAWHHSATQAHKNFGANLSIWDKLHGTYYSPAQRPQQFGIPLTLDLRRKLLFPFAARKAGSAR